MLRGHLVLIASDSWDVQLRTWEAKMKGYVERKCLKMRLIGVNFIRSFDGWSRFILGRQNLSLRIVCWREIQIWEGCSSHKAHKYFLWHFSCENTIPLSFIAVFLSRRDATGVSITCQSNNIYILLISLSSMHTEYIKNNCKQFPGCLSSLQF